MCTYKCGLCTHKEADLYSTPAYLVFATVPVELHSHCLGETVILSPWRNKQREHEALL